MLIRPSRNDMAAHAFWALWQADDESLPIRERYRWWRVAQATLTWLDTTEASSDLKNITRFN